MNIQMFVFLALCVVVTRLGAIAFSKTKRSFNEEAFALVTHLVITFSLFTVIYLVIC